MLLRGYSHIHNEWRRVFYSKMLRLKEYDQFDQTNPLSEELHKVKNNLILQGFFQSEFYFEEIREVIPTLFEIKFKYKSEFHKKYGEYVLNQQLIVVHVRRDDYVNSENEEQNWALPLTYYDHCLDILEQKVCGRILFISDDLNFVKKYYGHRKNCSFEKNTEIVDFQLVMHANIAVIANSSFSWWAAYLNERPDKIIFAPKYWLGYHNKNEFPVGVSYNLNWNWVEVG